MKKALVICGPTATGKTALALSIAKLLGHTTIVVADSRQVYQNLTLVSGRDIPQDLQGDIHFIGQDLFTPTDPANLSDYVLKVRALMQKEINSGQNLILVGGTGLYLKGLTENLSNIMVTVDPKLRDHLNTLSVTELQKLLQNQNPIKYAGLNQSDVNNPRRLIRHLEITLNASKTKPLPSLPALDFHWVGLLPPKDLVEKISQRVVNRLEDGALQEVEELLSSFPDKTLPLYSTLGVKDILDYLAHKIDHQTLIEQWTQKEVGYVKRQMTWFKKVSGIIWYDELTDRKSLALSLSKIF